MLDKVSKVKMELQNNRAVLKYQKKENIETLI